MLTITFTGRNSFSNEDIRRGIEAAEAVFAKHNITAEEAWKRNQLIAEELADLDDIWAEADYAASRAMCGGDDTTAAENATLELAR